MLQGVFGYFRNFEPYWYSLLIDSNIRVKIKKQKIYARVNETRW